LDSLSVSGATGPIDKIALLKMKRREEHTCRDKELYDKSFQNLDLQAGTDTIHSLLATCLMRRRVEGVSDNSCQEFPTNFPHNLMLPPPLLSYVMSAMFLSSMWPGKPPAGLDSTPVTSYHVLFR
jgi:hypothetical protein